VTSVICVLGGERYNLEKDDLTRFRLMLYKAAEITLLNNEGETLVMNGALSSE